MSGYHLVLTYEENGKTFTTERRWEGEGVGGMGGVLGKHTGQAESLKGIRYALVLVVLSMIDTVERRKHTWTP